MTRYFKRIAFTLARAVVLACLLLGALVIAYFGFRLIVLAGSTIASAWQAELCIPLIMLVAGACMCLLAGHFLGDNAGLKDVQRSKEPSKD